MKEQITLLIGKSGSGKDYRRTHAYQNHDTIISITSRPMRPNEINGKDYHFVDKYKFQTLVEENRLLEFRAYNTMYQGKPDVWCYGVPKAKLIDNRKYVAISTPEGCKSWIQHYGANNVKIEYVQVKEEVRVARAMERPGFDQKEWDRRTIADNQDFAPEVIQELEAMLGKEIVVIDNNKTENANQREDQREKIMER